MGERKNITPLGQLISLLKADAISIMREPVFLVNVVFGLFCPYLIWVFQGEINVYAENTFGLVNFSRYLIPCGLLLPVVLLGWVTGMLLLEDRDDRVLNSIEVTPIGRSGYFLYRIGITFFISCLIGLFSLGLLYPSSFPVMVYLMILIALESVIVSLCLVAIAGNKVEGLALSKLLNCLALFPLLALIDTPLRFIAGVLPSYWIGEHVFNGNFESAHLAHVVIALFSHAVILYYLFKISIERKE